jgi:hypothetical protein
MLGLEQLAELLEQHRAAAKARVKEFSTGESQACQRAVVPARIRPC